MAQGVLSGVPWTGPIPKQGVEVTETTTRVPGKANNTIVNFLAEVRERGLSKPNRFEITVFAPIAMDSKIVGLFADSAILPSLRMITSRQQLFGPPEFFPTGVDFGGDNFSVNFLVDRQMEVKTFFDDWIGSVFVNSNTSDRSAVNWPRYTTNYRSNYIGKIIVNQLDEADNVMYSVTLVDVFPVAVNPMQLDNAMSNTAARLNVTFNYRYWFTNTIDPVKVPADTPVQFPNLIQQTNPQPNTTQTSGGIPVPRTLTAQEQAQNVLQPGYNKTGGSLQNYFLVR